MHKAQDSILSPKGEKLKHNFFKEFIWVNSCSWIRWKWISEPQWETKVTFLQDEQWSKTKKHLLRYWTWWHTLVTPAHWSWTQKGQEFKISLCYKQIWRPCERKKRVEREGRQDRKKGNREAGTKERRQGGRKKEREGGSSKRKYLVTTVIILGLFQWKVYSYIYLSAAPNWLRLHSVFI